MGAASGDRALSRFQAAAHLLACPLCQSSMRLEGKSLVCGQKHCFDIARQGYVNLLQKQSAAKNYDAASFQNRQLILEAGFYRHVLDALLLELQEQAGMDAILDAGCGEGYYARQLSRHLACQMLATDLSRDSIQLAARADREHQVLWLVADLARLPIAARRMDCVLNIFSPANYQEFCRVLRPGGLLLKVVPGDQHLHELRGLVGEKLHKPGYDSARTVDYFRQHAQLTRQVQLVRTLPLDEAQREALIQMTPLLFNVDTAQLDLSDLQEITIAAELLIGRFS